MDQKRVVRPDEIKRRGIVFALRVLSAVACVASVAGCLMAQPTLRRNRPSAAAVDSERLRSHVVALSVTYCPRDWEHEVNLGACADYIAAHFTNAGAVVQTQMVPAQGRQYRNVIARFGVGRGSKVVVGAHYDACGTTPGADDNASGVAALMITDTAFYRNTEYHTINDTEDRLDYGRMSKVVVAVFEAIRTL